MTPGIKLVNSIIELACKNNNYARCLKNIKILSAEDGTCKAEFRVTEEHLNEGGTLHGGFSSTLVDCISTYALMTKNNSHPGVSVDLHVMFLKAAFPGDVLTIDAKTVRVGRSLAFLAVDLTKNDGKDIVVQGRHTKYIPSNNTS